MGFEAKVQSCTAVLCSAGHRARYETHMYDVLKFVVPQSGYLRRMKFEKDYHIILSPSFPLFAELCKANKRKCSNKMLYIT